MKSSSPLPDESSAAEASARSRLLDAAEALFAGKGFLAASVREITSRAGCNVAAVNYHFGGKEKLYEEVFRRRLSAVREYRIRRVEEELSRAEGQPELASVVRAFTNAFLEPLVADSKGRVSVELMVHEMLDPHLPPGMLLREMVMPVRESFVRAMRACVPELDEEHAIHCTSSVIGQLIHVLQLQRMFPHAGREGPTVDLEEMLEHIVQFSLGGIRALAGRGRE